MMAVLTSSVIMQNMNRYILYVRKSSESEDRQVMSLDAQETEMLRIAERDNLNVVEIIRESHSAKVTGQRPEFNRMIKGISAKTYDAILTWAPDRISRNAGDLGMIIDLMDAGKLICVRTYSQTFIDDPNSKFMFMMLGSQAKLENDQKSLNVKRGNREKLKRGDWINNAPFGYLNDRLTKTIVLDSVRAPFVVKMFELYSTGLYSYKQISNTLYEQGLRTRTGKKVHGGNVHRILNRTFYYGVMATGGKSYPGNHQPIITPQLYEKCQIISGNKSRPRPQTKGFTLSGFITCAVCGCAVTAEIKKGKYIYYHCTNGKGGCSQKSFNANEEALHELITQDLEKLYISPKIVDLVYRAKLEEVAQNDNYTNHALESVQKALHALQERKSRLVDTFTAGDIDEALYKHKLQGIDREHNSLSQQMRNMEQNTQNPISTIELIYSKFKRGNTMSKRYLESTNEERRLTLAEALSKSTLRDRNILNLQYKSLYDAFARTPVNPSFSELLGDRESNPN